jgi:protein-disulfide isomerase
VSTTTARKGGHASKAAGNRRPQYAFFGIAAVAVVVVAAFVAIQTMGGSSSNIPPRVATGEGRILGDANAPVTIVEYADFQCPVCKRAESAIISQLEKDYIQTGKVKLEFRMYPFIGQESFNAAQAADAAGEQGKFWEYHDALYNAQGRENGGNFTYDKLVAIAGQVGLDVPKFEEALSSNKYLDPIQKEADSAREHGVSSTPTFFVGDKKLEGIRPYDEFTAAIGQALQAGETAQ